MRDVDQESKTRVIKNLRKLPNPDQKSMMFGGRVLSPNELISEVERGTELGKELVRLDNSLEQEKNRP